MSESQSPAGQDQADIAAICAKYGNDRHRMMDILLDVQTAYRHVSEAAKRVIARQTGARGIEVAGMVGFYAFLSDTPKGEVSIQLCDDIVDRFQGFEDIAQVFEEELGTGIGKTSEDGKFSIDVTPCIGMCDQAPAAMVNDLVFTSLTIESARELARSLKAGALPGSQFAAGFTDLSPLEQMHAQVDNNIRLAGASLLSEVPKEAGLKTAMGKSAADIISIVSESGLRGCGGAGFPTGRKWAFAAQAESSRHFVFCNADEGEPGTFKDRVLLTERPHLIIEGMTIAARAIGAEEGLIYLRGEYVYMKPYLEEVLAERRANGHLGDAIMGDAQFNFDIRIQMGAGAYICGEEGALISSCEGLPGEPKTRPPFPVTHGYLGHPTVVNNVETFCHAARILDRGADWFHAMGTEESHGTKLLSVSGDCGSPGVYELPYGITVASLLDMVGGNDAAAVLAGGPSGAIISRDKFHRKLCFEDLPTGGAVVVFNGKRDLLEIVEYYLEFFVDESCGYCTPCRVGNVFLKMAIEKLRSGHADLSELDNMRSLSKTIIETSRCGLGQTSPNPVLSTLDNFPMVYASACKQHEPGMKSTFDIQKALEGSRRLAKRRSYIFDPDYSA